MKKIYFAIVCWAFVIFSMVSCQKGSFLDETQYTTLFEQTVFADSTYTMNFLNGIYSNVGFSTNPFRFSTIYTKLPGLESSCDEAEGYLTGGSSSMSGGANTFVQFTSGTVNPDIVSNDAWKTSYANIRAVNLFLKYLPNARFTDQLKLRVKGEARFLRAWYYSMLLEHYGGVPLVGDTIYDASSVIVEARNTFGECVNYILQECDSAALNLPAIQTATDFGRVGALVCKALKARVLLYAASPLFNGGSMAGQEPLKSITGYPSYDKERWNLAQNAAADVINSSQYSLVLDNTTAKGYGFYSVFVQRKSSEMIFARMEDNNRDLEDNWLPPSTMSTPVAVPYLEMVNAFGMSNGLDITDPASGYDPENPYSGRDPRLDYTIIHDQTPVMRRPELQRFPVNLYIDATDTSRQVSGVDAVHKGTLTGYYIYKMVDQNVAPQWFNHSTPRCLPLIRYAEILLDYAEARNEYLDIPDNLVYSNVELIRQRAGLDPYTLPTGLSQADMRQVIQDERRRELAFEGHRFFDVRRWKIASKTENRIMHGTEITKTASRKVYKTFEVRTHSFVDRMYLWPIPQTEISKSPKLLQNPGY